MSFTYLPLLAPLSPTLAWFHAPPWIFLTTAAIVPLAEWIRRATEQMARRAGAVVGGLSNVTSGARLFLRPSARRLIQARALRCDGCPSAPLRWKRCSPMTLRALTTSSHDRPLFPDSVWIIMSFIERTP